MLVNLSSCDSCKSPHPRLRVLQDPSPMVEYKADGSVAALYALRARCPQTREFIFIARINEEEYKSFSFAAQRRRHAEWENEEARELGEPEDKEGDFLSPEGYRQLNDELQELLSKQKAMAQELRRTRESGSAVTGPDYQEIERKLEATEKRIVHLKYSFYRATPFEKSRDKPPYVRMWSTVTVVNQEGSKERFHIVGKYEANLAASPAKIWHESPVGKALMSHKIGEQVEIFTPSGMIIYIVADIQ